MKGAANARSLYIELNFSLTGPLGKGKKYSIA
jgi:hypothetical protein